MIYVLAFLLTLGILIVVHEYGHYRVARYFGVRVLRFSVGFGRVIWRRQPVAGGTEFTLSAIPLGGYVKMLDSREAPVAVQDLPQAFDHQPLRARTAIVVAGPLANLVLAVLLYAVASWVGQMEPLPWLAQPPAGSLAAQAGIQAGDRVLAVSRDDSDWEELMSLNDLRWQVARAALDAQPLQLQVTDAGSGHRREVSLPLDRLAGRDMDAAALGEIGIGLPFVEPVLAEIKIGGAAAQAGLRQGDRVLSIDGQPVPDAQSLYLRIRESAKLPVPTMEWQIERAGVRMLLLVEPHRVSDGDRQVGRIDAYLGQAPAMSLVRRGFVEGLSGGFSRTWQTATMSLKTLGRILIGQASVKQISGPLTMAQVAGQSVQRGLADYLAILAAISVGLGVLNLLPLPMLDGGHLIYYLFEGVTGRPVPDLWLAWLQRGGAFVLLLMMSIALSNDVARLLGLQ